MKRAPSVLVPHTVTTSRARVARASAEREHVDRARVWGGGRA